MQRNEPNAGDDVCRAYGRLPNGIIRDAKLSLAAKVIAAVRVTFTGTYRTNERTQGRYVRRGLGKNVARAAIAELRRYGFLVRSSSCGQQIVVTEIRRAFEIRPKS